MLAVNTLAGSSIHSLSETMTVIQPARRRKIRQSGGLVLAAAIASMAAPGLAAAEVTRIVIDRQAGESPTFGGLAASERGQYEQIIGRAYGELDPQDRRNALIQDIQLAPRNARGRVETSPRFR
jgi:hypothetical protein